MSGQRLPLRIGGPDPAHGRRRLWKARLLRPRPRALVALVGLSAAAGGAWLGAEPAPYVVSLDSDAYVVAGARLPARGQGVYAGSMGALVLRHSQGAIMAGGSGSLRGTPVTGSCLLRDGETSEQCHFSLGGRRLGAVDRRSPLGWSRLYSDGTRADIWLRGGGLIPVPFPVGA